MSTRALGLGNASIPDDYAIFYNPARIVQSSGIGGSFARYGSNATSGALASSANVGPLSYGWGVGLLQYRARASSAYPFAPAELVEDGTRRAMSLMAMVGAQYTYKRFATGFGVKFAEDRVDAIVPSPGGPAAQPPIDHTLLLVDIGTTHRLLGGTAELVLQNIGGHSNSPLPTLAKVGWTRPAATQQVDFVFAGELTARQSWIGGGGGAEISYGWIEGWSAALRAGARRPETDAQHPVTVGGTLTADRLVFDYALEFFEGNRYAHHITVRWR